MFDGIHNRGEKFKQGMVVKCDQCEHMRRMRKSGSGAEPTHGNSGCSGRLAMECPSMQNYECLVTACTITKKVIVPGEKRL
jgi:hypothetical protein